MKFSLRLLLVAIFSVTATTLRAEDAKMLPTKDFVYKKIDAVELMMTVHYPPGWKETDRRPAIVFFFGGGWTNGKVGQFETQAEYLAERGMVAARADYRVKSRHNVTPDKCVEDAKSAIRYVRKNFSTLGVDPSKIVASGGSAGGHLAACTSLVTGLEAAGEDANVSSQPNAMVLFNPVLNFHGIPMWTKYLPSGDEALAKQISPTLHLSRNTPPTLIHFGTSDALAVQGTEFVEKSKATGNRVELFTADGQPHGFFNRSPWKEKTLYRTDEFLATLGYLQGPPTLKLP